MPSSRQSRGTFRTALALGVAGLVGLPAWIALGQPAASPLFVDDSPLASDGLIRAGELASVGNLDESVTVLQGLLDGEADRLLASPGEPDLFTPVRGRVHAALQANPRLLERYRELQEPAAAALLGSSDPAALERSRLLTPSGFEAALRVAQARFEAAQFDAALQTLEQLDGHPDRVGAGARSAAVLMTQVASYAGPEWPESARARLDRWRREASMEVIGVKAAEAPAIASAVSVFTSKGSMDLAELLPRPLWSDELGERLPLESTLPVRTMQNAPREGSMWLFASPTAMGDTVFVNDSRTVTAWNRFSLSQRWRVQIEGVQGKRYAVGPQQNFEEMAGVAADATHVVALMGLAIQNTDTPRRALTCIDQRTGRVAWNVVLEDLRLPELEQSRFRGPVLLDQGVVVVEVEKDVSRRRLEGAYLLGIDAASGEVRWLRPLGSSGSLAYGNRPPVHDAPSVAGGVAYVVNRLGLVAAVETVSGRVRWIRRMGGGPFVQAFADQPWEASSPIVTASGVLAASPNRQEIVLLDADDGRLKARCATTKFDTPDYLLRSGDLIVGVSSTSLVAGRLAELGPDMTTWKCARFPSGSVRGRAMAFDSSVLVPTAEGLVVYDPSAESERVVARIGLDHPGNLLPLEGQLIAVDDSRIHTYLVWEIAERMLSERMDRSPGDPSPATTYAELSFRAGRIDGILPALDRALAALERDPLGSSVVEEQRRLFRAVFSMVEPSRGEAGFGEPALVPIEVRRGLLDRLRRCAVAPGERVAFLLADGRFHETIGRPADALAAYQSVLDAEELASASFLAGETATPAEFEATRRIRRLAQLHGAVLYEAYQADADRALAAAGQAMEPESFEALARRYPLARASVSAWLQASSRYSSRGRSKLAVQALEEGLAVAEHALDSKDPMVGELTGRLVQHQVRSGLFIPALRALEGFERDHAGLSLTEEGRTLDAVGLKESIRAELAWLDRRPRIGPQAVGATPIVGWSVLLPRAGEASPPTSDRVMMISESGEQGLFVSAGPGALTKSWGGVKDEDYLWMDRGGVMFARASGAENRQDFALVRRDAETGRVLWQTEYFRSTVPRAAIDDLVEDASREFIPVIDTPLDPRVPVTEVTFVFDARTVVLLERTGRAAAFDVETGRVLWTTASTVKRVHDAALGAGTLLIGGSDAPIDLSKPMAQDEDDRPSGVVASFDARTGQPMYRWVAEDRVRWVQAAVEGYPIIGLDRGVVSLDAYRGRTRWRAAARTLGLSLAAWPLAGRVIVRGDNNDLHQISVEDGSMLAEPLDARDRLGGGFGTARIDSLGDHASLATRLGLAVFSADGGLVGVDANENDDALYFGGFGDRYSITVTPTNGLLDEEGQTAVHINVFSNPSLKLESRFRLPLGAQVEPGPFEMLDGKLLVTCGGITMVVDMPPLP